MTATTATLTRPRSMEETLALLQRIEAEWPLTSLPNLRAWCRQHGVPPSTLAAWCVLAGVPYPGQYVRLKRLTRALADYRAGETGETVACRYGYSSAQSLGRQCRTLTGRTLGQWRRMANS